MLFHRLELFNFGQYRGEHAVELAPPDDQHPVILFGGLNGAGKTTLLDAIQLVLYGNRARLAKRNGGAYPDYLRSAIHRAADPAEGAAVDLTFSHRSDGESRTYQVRRLWRVTGKGLAEKVEVSIDGNFDRVFSDSWDEQVEQFMPAGLAHLLLFDGEQIADLADLAKSKEVLRTGLYSLLGLDLADQLIRDLVVLERRKRVEVQSKSERDEIASLRAELEAVDQQVSEDAQELAGNRNRLDQAARARRKFDRKFKAAGGDRYEQRGQLERSAGDERARLAGIKGDMVTLAAGAAPLLMVRNLLGRVAAQDGREQRAHEASTAHQVLRDHDAKALARLRASGAEERHLTTLKSFFEGEQARLERDAAGEVYLQLSADGRTDLKSLQARGLDQTREEIGRLARQYEESALRLADLERELAAVPDDDAVADLLRRRQELQAALDEATAAVAVCNEKLVRRQTERDGLKAKLGKLIERKVRADFDQEDLHRLVDYSGRSRALLVEFRTAVLRKHLDRIRDLMLDSFRALLHKEALIGDLQIEPESLELRLFAKDGEPLVSDQLSAGERQILAVALLWGLARASGRPLPTVIDTPLGRLDSKHRGRLVSRYFPFASQQVVLLSTDEEIDAEQLKALRPFIGRQYRLEFDEPSNSTRIAPGYFWEGAEA